MDRESARDAADRKVEEENRVPDDASRDEDTRETALRGSESEPAYVPVARWIRIVGTLGLMWLAFEYVCDRKIRCFARIGTSIGMFSWMLYRLR